MPVLALSVFAGMPARGSDAQYIGAESCALCHVGIAATQARSAMAKTWLGKVPSWLSNSFNESVANDLPTQLTRAGDSITYSVALDAKSKLELPVAISVGGRRHGLGFLLAIDEVSGIPLARGALVQARYAWSPEFNKLLLAPGCTTDRPHSLESALGLVLSPTFESRCLSCHGQPDKSGSGHVGGVRCEACHGPGSAHLAGISKGDPKRGIINPKRLSVEESIDVCAHCHVGLTKFSDPSPSDLLVANQVQAIRSSECFLQSGKGFSCTTCHDPHDDHGDDGNRATRACLGCHSASVASHAAICPVNRADGCIGCHMPSTNMGPLHLVDHMIRVHPEQITPSELRRTADVRTAREPKSEYLSIISTRTSEAAAAARLRLATGEPFYKVAREVSTDGSSPIGGYLGRKTILGLEAEMQRVAVRLRYGESSEPFTLGGRWLILQRLPRDFKWQAEQLQQEAERLGAGGYMLGAIKKSQQALMIYPQFLRALRFIGMTYTQAGNPAKGRDVLSLATRLYPQDASVEFALGITLELIPNREQARQAYERVIALEPDFTAAYVNLGMLCYSAGNWADAIKTFKEGLEIDPLSAELNYDVGLALEQSGNLAEGVQAVMLARNLDPELVKLREQKPGRP